MLFSLRQIIGALSLAAVSTLLIMAIRSSAVQVWRESEKSVWIDIAIDIISKLLGARDWDVEMVVAIYILLAGGKKENGKKLLPC